MLGFISVLSVASSLCLAGFMVLSHIMRKRRLDPMARAVLKRRSEAKGSKAPWDDVLLKMHAWYGKMPVIRELMDNLERSLTLVGEKDRRYLMKKTSCIITGLLAGCIVLTVLFWRITGNPFYTAVFVVFLWYLSDSYVDYFIARSHHRLLEQMIRFFGYVRHKYYEYLVVDDAVYEATQSLGPDDREMAVQGELIYDIFMASGKESALARYLETAPNPFLKMFVNFSHMTMEYGDQKTDGSSVYLLNLGFLTRNIQLELDKRRRLDYALKSMNIIVMLPLFFIAPLRDWAIGNFAPLGMFYDSPMGKYIEILTIAIILGAMVMLNRIQNLERGDRERKKLKKLIDRIRLPLDEKWKEKWLFGGAGFILALMLVLTVQYGARRQLERKVYYSDQFLGARLSEEDQQKREQESVKDYPFIRFAKEETDLEDIRLYVGRIGKESSGSEEMEERALRIDEKMRLFSLID